MCSVPPLIRILRFVVSRICGCFFLFSVTWLITKTQTKRLHGTFASEEGAVWISKEGRRDGEHAGPSAKEYFTSACTDSWIIHACIHPCTIGVLCDGLINRMIFHPSSSLFLNGGLPCVAHPGRGGGPGTVTLDTSWALLADPPGCGFCWDPRLGSPPPNPGWLPKAGA